MIAWLLKKIAQTKPPAQAEQRPVAPEQCAAWQEIVRALEQQPRNQDVRERARSPAR